MRTVTFSSPSGTVPVSITGRYCEMGCAHCGGRYLEHMKSPAWALQALEAGRASSVLVSGGCDLKGRVPFMGQLPLIREFRLRGRVNLHTGLVGEAEARALSGLVDVVSLDMVGDDETAREVYGHNLAARAYRDAYLALRGHVKVVPHICIGLRGGCTGHESRALDFLVAEGVDSVVLLVFRPTRRTAFEDCQPPSLEAVKGVMLKARRALPGATISLGCMRPGGSYRSRLDRMALEIGIDQVVNPSPAARQYASDAGFEVLHTRECCSL